MEDKRLDRQVEQAFAHITPDIFDSVLSDCRRQKGSIMAINKPTRRKKLLRRMAGMAAALLLLVGGVSAAGLYRLENTAVASVSLDVNPSVEIQVNAKEKVITVNALNEDGEKIIDGMDFSGSSVDVAVNALIGSMLRQGYLSELANSILLSVESPDAGQAAALEEKLCAEIDNLLQTGGLSGSVLSQRVQADEELTALAQEYGLSLGKAQLIRSIVEQDGRYRFETLAGLTINDLNILSEGLELGGVSSTGAPSDNKYIGSAAALHAALEHAGLTPEQISKLKSELDYEDGGMVYELAFEDNENEYAYEIEAITGQILKSEKELLDHMKEQGKEATQILEHQAESVEDLVREQSQSFDEWLNSASGDWADWARRHGDEIERWAEQNGDQWEAWAEQYAGDWEAWARDHADQIVAWALEQGRLWKDYGELWEAWAESIFDF